MQVQAQWSRNFFEVKSNKMKITKYFLNYQSMDFKAYHELLAGENGNSTSKLIWSHSVIRPSLHTRINRKA